MIGRTQRLLSLVVVSALFALPLAAQSFNVDFGTNPSGVQTSSSFGAAAGQTGTWNVAGNGATNLVSLNGAPTGASVAVTSDDETGYASNCTGNAGDLLNDNFYSNAGVTWNANFSGLADGQYTVYLYGPSHTSVTTGNMLVNGTAVSGVSGDDCAFTAGTTYTSVTVNVSGGTLTISGSDASFSGLAGVQLVTNAVAAGPAVPALSGTSLALLAGLLAAVALLVVRAQA